jgi:hypothetical protein
VDRILSAFRLSISLQSTPFGKKFIGLAGVISGSATVKVA